MTDGTDAKGNLPLEETVELTESESVVPRGSATTHWLVRQQAVWVAVAKHPRALVGKVEPRPGVVWMRRIILRVARGTELLCVHAAPRETARSPLGFLQFGLNPKRRVIRTQYRVGAGGRLEGRRADR